jgi:CheY-like chemotaxis protein
MGRPIDSDDSEVTRTGVDNSTDFSENTSVVLDPFAPKKPVATRSAPEIPIQYKTFEEFVVAYTEDISRGNLFIPVETPLPSNTIVRLKLALPADGPTISIIGRVTYQLDPETAAKLHRQPGMGVAFVEVEGGPLSRQLEAYFTLHLSQDPSKKKQTGSFLVVDGGRSPLCALNPLSSAGHRVAVAATGLEALGAVLANPPDVVVIPASAEVIDGFQFVTTVRQRATVGRIGVLILDDTPSADRRVRAYRSGADDYVEMPCSTEELMVRAERFLTRHGKASGDSTKAFRGDLAQIPLPSVLSFIEIERRSGQLLIVRETGMAELFIRAGQVVDVALEPNPGVEPGIQTLFHVLDWLDGNFELSSMDVDREQTIVVPTSMALLEHARIQDEANNV